MSDLALHWDVAAADLALIAGDLATDEGLETAVIVSLFSDRRADDGEALPDGSTDRRGWWADARDDRLGSLLWLLSREKQMAVVLERARAYATQALAWLIADRVAAAVDVRAAFTRPGWLGLAVTITRPTGDQVAYRFEGTWRAEAQRAGLA